MLKRTQKLTIDVLQIQYPVPFKQAARAVPIGFYPLGCRIVDSLVYTFLQCNINTFETVFIELSIRGRG